MEETSAAERFAADQSDGAGHGPEAFQQRPVYERPASHRRGCRRRGRTSVQGCDRSPETVTRPWPCRAASASAGGPPRRLPVVSADARAASRALSWAAGSVAGGNGGQRVRGAWQERPPLVGQHDGRDDRRPRVAEGRVRRFAGIR